MPMPGTGSRPTARATACCRIASRNGLAKSGSDAIVASHGGVSRVLRGLILQLPFADIPLLEVPQDKVLVLSAGSARWL